ncbi:hypothetical protein B0H17DRAFT_366124 [Mycena rosella]|uniref:Uncharacterized protein n=1 Tax=Mycena rosella TaxID=1033263 RepID=A0AAD7GZU1_MYCRO|nr:hypothetical protein B0H17DRAFT_366124 [Mycena rosella]
MPTKTYDGSDDDVAVPFPGTAAKTPRKAASTSTAKTPRTTTRSLSRANTNVPLYEEEATTPPPKKRGRSKSVSRPKVAEDDQDEEAPASPLPPTRQRRPTTAARSRSKSVSRPASALDAANLFDDDDEPQRSSKPEPEPQVPRKASRSKSKARKVEPDDGQPVEEPVARKPSRSKSKAREVEAELDGAQSAEEVVARKPSRSKAKPKAADIETEEPKKPASRSQSSKPQPPSDDASSDDGWFVAPIPPPPAAPARSRTKSVSRAKGKDQVAEVDDEPAVVSRKEQKTKQRDTAGGSEEPETKRPTSKSQTNPPDEVVDPVVRKASRAKPKASVAEEPEAKKPPSRARAKPAPPPSNDQPEEDEMGMEQYLPPPSSQRPPAVNSRSKPPSKVDEAAEEPKAPRVRKPSSRSASKPVVPKFELAAPSAEAVEEEEPERDEHVAPPPTRTRKASTRSTSAAPASRSASATAKVKAKSKRDPTPSHDSVDLDLDTQAPGEPEEPEPVIVSRQVSRSKLAPPAAAAGPSYSEATDIQVSTSRKPASKASAAPAHKPRSTSQSQARPPKAKKEAQYYDDQARGSGDESGDGLPVVEIISTDDDEPEATKAAPKPKGKGKAKGKEKKFVVEAEEKRLVLDHPEQMMEEGDDDVEMAEVEESMMELQPGPSLPATPPRSHAPAASTDDEPSAWNAPQASPEGFAFIPPLATDPFENIESLTEAEQDMTVEEWIRYQMGIEYERFKRDGERQLGMFDLRAEEPASCKTMTCLLLSSLVHVHNKYEHNDR